jgi:hypothetical protein
MNADKHKFFIFLSFIFCFIFLSDTRGYEKLAGAVRAKASLHWQDE